MAKDNRYLGEKKNRSSLLGFLGKLFLSLLRICFIFLFFAVLGFGLLAGYDWLTNSPLLSLKKVRIMGNHRLARSEILHIAGIERGKNLLELRIGHIKERLDSEPWIKKVFVQRVFPDELKIRVEEVEPIFWVKKENSIYYADKFGESIAPVTPEKFISLPLLCFNEQRQEQKKYVDSLQEQFVKSEFPFSMAEAEWIRFLCDEIVEIFIKDRSITLRLGTEELQVNFASLKKAWRDLDNRDELSKVSRILVYNGKCWVRFPR